MEEHSGQEVTSTHRGDAANARPISISGEPGLRAVDTARLVGLVRAASHAAGARLAIALRLVGDATMAELHRRHCGDPATTDVLTFPGGEPGHPGVDLVLCVDEALRQASLRGHSVEQELLLYAVHGLLHCLGHDDHDDLAAAAMHAEEDRVLEAIGVGATFARPITPAEGADR